MSKVIPIEHSCAYLVDRARRNRREGRFDEAMTLLWRAKGEFGSNEEIEWETALIYEEMNCPEEAAMRCRRVVRMGGRQAAMAALHLGLYSAQNAETDRALSYLGLTMQKDREGALRGEAALLARQIRSEADRPRFLGRNSWAASLEERSAECLRSGRIGVALRNCRRAIRLRPTAEAYALLACCQLLRKNGEEAVSAAEEAHRRKPSSVQALCILADAYALAGIEEKKKRAIRLCALRARSVEDMLGAAVVCAKHGEDGLTLRLTERMLKKEPFLTRAMLLRACALANLGRTQEATRLFGRLSVLLPENPVCESCYRLLSEQGMIGERLTLGAEMPKSEAAKACSLLISALYEAPETIRADQGRVRRLCAASAWAIRSQLAGRQMAEIALLLMGGLATPETVEMLLDALMDPGIDDGFKGDVMFALMNADVKPPICADLDGRFVRLAASAEAKRPGIGGSRSIAQRAVDALVGQYPDAPEAVFRLFVRYVERYGAPAGHMEEACAAALEYAFLVQTGRRASLERIARRRGVSARLSRLFFKRIERANGENPS